MNKVPIGSPVDNTSAYLLDRDMLPVGKGKVAIIINTFMMIIVMTTQTLTQVKGSRPASQRDMCCTHSSFKVLNLLLLPLIIIIIISSVVIISSSSYKSRRIIKTMKKIIKLSTQHNPNNHHKNLAIKIFIITAKCL